MYSYASRLTARLAPAASMTGAASMILSSKTSSCSQLVISSRVRAAVVGNFTASSRRLLSASSKETTAKVEKLVTEKVATAAAAAAAAGKTTTSAGGGGGGRLLAWYEGHLTSRPIVTKMFTGAFLWGLGDTVAQIVPKMAAGEQGMGDYDWPRTGRAAFFGFALHAPLSHAHFNFLEWLTVRWGITGLRIPVFKAVMEQFVYWSWISNSLYHGALGAMQGKNMEQIYGRIADVLWDTQKAQWVFWVPVQLVNFQYVPVRHQLNVVLLTSVVWTALLSAWYPPEEEEKRAAAEKA